LELVQNQPFFEAELEKITGQCDPYLNDPEIGPKYDYVVKAMDCMYACEDVRDHTNEILECMTRAGGVMNIGIMAGPKLSVENKQENADALAAEYEQLLERYPDFKPKIEQCVGHGLAILRTKHKFQFSSKYRFFF
jgi:hypothetical protein